MTSPSDGMVREDPRAARAVLVVGVIAVGLSLRTLMAGLPPLVPAIRDELGLSSAAIGILTSLPVVCMGLFAPPAARLGQRIGAARVVSGAMLLVALGNVVRYFGSHLVALYGGTLCAGLGIAMAGTLLPVLVKSQFPPERAGAATGLTMLAMMGGAGVSSGLAVPLERLLGSWQASLAVWGGVAVAGLVGWLPVDRALHVRGDRDIRPAAVTHGLPWRSATAWLVAAYLAVQSWQFYSSLTWLAPTYVDLGWSDRDAGYLLSAFTAAQLVSGLVGPVLADRVRDWRVLFVWAAGLGLAGSVAVWLAPGGLPWLWVVLLGAGQGAAFALGLVLLVRYAVSPAAAARFSAMAFLVSYSLAALGPATMGALRDTGGGFRLVWASLSAVMVAQLILSTRMNPDRTVVR